MTSRSDEPGTDGTQREPLPPASTEAYLLVNASDGSWRSYPLPEQGTVTIGRGEQATVRLPEASVSRLHARLDSDGGNRYRLTDLGSANGTLVGGVLVQGSTAAVRPGEPIQLGNNLLVVQVPRSRDRSNGERVTTGSAAMADVDELIGKIAPTLVSVLLLGETGVGKDVIAERIHARSTRAAGPLLRLNCAGLSSTLLESELFGHEKGAFTGAQQAKPGLLEVAAGGTVFLDEIGEMPLEVQAKLLLAIEQRVIRRVGAVQATRIDVRFVCATHRDLESEIRRERFRADFYYRINGMTIRIPPLRERLDEIEGLITWFAQDSAARLGRGRAPELGREVIARLRAHTWPGNIRELRNVVERAVVLADDDVVTVGTLIAAGLPSLPGPSCGGLDPDRERARLLAVLADCGGNQSRAARLLGISRNTLIARIEEYGIARPRGLRA